MENRNVIGIYHLTKRYDDRTILRDVNLQGANGELTAAMIYRFET